MKQGNFWEPCKSLKTKSRLKGNLKAKLKRNPRGRLGHLHYHACKPRHDIRIRIAPLPVSPLCHQTTDPNPRGAHHAMKTDHRFDDTRAALGAEKVSESSISTPKTVEFGNLRRGTKKRGPRRPKKDVHPDPLGTPRPDPSGRHDPTPSGRHVPQASGWPPP